MISRLSFCLGLILLSPLQSPLCADEKPGHSVHGESFAEGPRRFAVPIPGTGNVDFPVTTKSPEAQKFFNQGVGQLHGFWYYEAERSFRQVLSLDPDCVLAYWGMAMANMENETRARGIIAKAVEQIAKAGEKEQLFIRSLEKYYAPKANDDERKAGAKQLVKNLEEIVARWPDDIEAKAFLVFQLWHNGYKLGIEITSHAAIDALAQLIFQKNPLHPAHHYIVHLWDKERADQALKSCALCGQSAPDIAHMWHMPGHIFSNLERYADAAWQMEAGVRTDHRMMMQRGTMPDQIHNYAHNSEWMVRNFNHLGRVHDALQVTKDMIAQPRIPRSAKVAEQPDQKFVENGSCYSLGRQRLVDTLIRWELWDEAISLAETPYLEAGGDFEDAVKREQLLALAWFGKCDAPRGAEAMKALEERLRTLKNERTTAAEKAEEDARTSGQNADQANKAMADAMLPHTKKVQQISKVLGELRVWEQLASGQKDQAKALAKALKDIPEERAARIDFLTGETDKAIETARALAKKSQHQVQPQALLVDLLAAAGKMDDAKTEFARLREISSWCDLELPILKRLAPVISASAAPADWRQPAPIPTDVGSRPDLETLGPLQWGSRHAPEWSLTSATGQTTTSADFTGRPHIVIFFLGKGCTHCIQQLQAFEPLTADFEKAGLPIIAISTDSPEGVAESLKLAKANGGFPFPILSDPNHETFKRFDAYDDFESKPLHGTYFIDASGEIRWQHISYEPFMKPDFLLQEAQRLMKIKQDNSPATQAATSHAIPK